MEDGRIAIGEEKITVQLDKFEEPDHDIADQTYSYRWVGLIGGCLDSS